ncbi:MAG: DUF465 domain-containing protein [Desulfovibrionaceae bacterium]
MEQRDLDLLEKYSAQDPELKLLWEEHTLYEKQLDKLESKPFLTPQEEKVARDVKKKKLSGKTKMQGIIDRYRKLEG